MAAAKKTVKKSVAKKPAAKEPSVEKLEVQYRVVFGKGDEAVEGPDDADVVFVCAVGDADADPTVAFMQGKLKATGNTGVIFSEMSSGRARQALSRLASRP